MLFRHKDTSCVWLTPNTLPPIYTEYHSLMICRCAWVFGVPQLCARLNGNLGMDPTKVGVSGEGQEQFRIRKRGWGAAVFYSEVLCVNHTDGCGVPTERPVFMNAGCNQSIALVVIPSYLTVSLCDLFLWSYFTEVVVLQCHVMLTDVQTKLFYTFAH